MGTKVIYFEKVSPAAHEFIETYKSPGTEVAYWDQLNESQRKLCLSQAQYLITAAFPIKRQLLEKAPHVKLIQKTGSGVDNIDLIAAAEMEIMVSSTPGVNSTSVAEMTIGMILCLYRKLHFLDRETKQGKWLMFEYRPFMFEMKGKTHGIIGIGNIGKQVARLSKGFGTKIIYFDAYRLSPEKEKELGVSYVPLKDLLSTSDIMSLHVPLLPETKNMIGEKEFRLMKPNAILINVARGNIVDELALAQALKEGRLLGAGLDTFASEPVHKDNPLFGLDNALVTPHIAGGTRDVLEEVLRLSFQNIAKMEGGALPDNIIRKV
ncbi:2-hydroxyacid dehydrogenase [Pelosinus sp. UFO1]|uniref:2-hydroxyacid dehydrogenase n=1 Tax=Pelosinus sp. UFO1 TaxID=484770 RepID=UPI0004D1843F|nr:2-hydroxyacid dehydrogenase [Pelosinus sp. UFO1]AIF50725.1 Phosphoglycerate dehydrogenase [Pelosinus sp. UFO1]